MKIDLYQVDAFTTQLFAGNPAAVCPLTAFLPDAVMQSIAAENNLSETAFFIPKDDHYHIRWFTPNNEVKLCGHATLATAFVIFNFLDKQCNSVTFDSLSGLLHVKKLANGSMQLDFPVIAIEQVEPPTVLVAGLGIPPKAVYRSTQDYLVIFDNREQIVSLKPDFNKLLDVDLRAVIISSETMDEYDFVSRFFAPKCGIPEDPVTGSAHCILAPYWAKQLNKTVLRAKQLSQRGGELLCEVKENRVLLTGNAVLFMRGEIFIGSLIFG